MASLLSTLLLAGAASAQFSDFSEFSSFASETVGFATPTTSISFATPTGSSDEPCAQLASLVQDGEVYFPADIAHGCLKSVPVDKSGDEKLIDEIKLLWEWQSDSGWIKKAPDSWQLGSVDVQKELDNIKSNLGKFESEYDVQLAIQNITVRTGNFHFNYRPDILRMFRFWRTVGITSISSDGTSLPQLYTEADALEIAFGADASGFSNIEQINGQDAWEYLQAVADLEQYLDKDSRMANVFTPGGGDSYGAFEVQGQYHGPETELKFKNGTTATYENYARFGTASSTAYGDFNETTYWYDIENGQDVFDTFCQGDFTGDVYSDYIGMAADKNVTSFDFEPPMARLLDDRPVHDGKIHPTHHLRRRQTIPETYPTPIVEDESEVVAGYFLEGDGYDNVAVLKMVSFAPEEDTTGEEFQSVVSEFLQAAKDEKKEKLIIDLRENGGGMIQLYLDTFKQLFPKDEPFSGQYYRAQDQFNGIGDAVAKLLPLLGESYKSDLTEGFYFWAWWAYVTGKSEEFKDWDSFKGPVDLNGDKFTTLFQWSLENSAANVLLSPGFSFYNDSSADAPFKPENIVMLTDGLCGSACAAFAENMKNIAGVKTVVVGTRPENKPMQGVAGSKGGQVTVLSQFPYRAKTMIQVLAQTSETQEIGNSLNSTKVKDLAEVSQILVRAGDERTRLQVKEHLRKGDDTGTPLEFHYEAADCKIFYTAESWADPTAIWTQTWDAFTDDKKCVEGSTGDKTSISGGFKPFGTGQVKDEDLPKSKPNQEESGNGGEKKGAAANVRVSFAAFAMIIATAVLLM